MIYSTNEWDQLRRVVVGRADHANWPVADPVFSVEQERTLWKESPVPSGPVPQWIIDESNEDLDTFARVLETAGVIVERPDVLNFVAHDGMSAYCPRDRLLVYRDTVVNVPMMYPCRDMEKQCYYHIADQDSMISMPRHDGMVLDAANILRLNDTWLFLESDSGNRKAYNWLQEKFSDVNIELCNFYAGTHIDSTISLVREGLCVLNASRINESNVPKCLESWDKIWVSEVVPQGFYQYPYASAWIALNMFSIDPQTVVVDAAQTNIIKQLEKKGLTVIPQTLRHSRTLGGGFHCVTLDIWRSNE
jgi:N-dimethylarginine dimethylaminohydrolase